jgi:hypothetical protein
VSLSFMMRRLTAHLVLAVILSGLLSPLALALMVAGTPACCLPGGKHHCSQSPKGLGFTSQKDKCPYACLAVVTNVRAIRVEKFYLATPALSGYWTSAAIPVRYRTIPGQLFTRGPPLLFL